MTAGFGSFEALGQAAASMAASAGAGRPEPLLGWFPAEEYEAALRTWPDLTEPGGIAAAGRSHADYCKAFQARLREAAAAGMTGIKIVPIRAVPLQPPHGTADDPGLLRANHALDVAQAHPELLISWPPGRNEPCWCGAQTKYKKCCAAP
ncbi:SEC-C metal-binding domain-containing protein [Asanoa sp. NPDC049518]|uniref:SEC-C metal-binding domain-containing protein n=1 Tax=unclassified Asanoa TaxID=2685164 RepID=UPI003434FF94